MRTLPLAAAIAFASASAAFAQGSPNQPVPNPSPRDQGTQTQSQQSIRQQVQNNLTQAGYTDIKIMPESFLVRAKDKNGNPVMMVINPDSITSLTEVNPRGANSTTTGSAPASGNPTGGVSSNNNNNKAGTSPK
jgi:hypothetical protein